jgi:hypothetical protein
VLLPARMYARSRRCYIQYNLRRYRHR